MMLEENTLTYETAWLVWSLKHAAWWGPDRCGYTSCVAHAGVYSEDAMREIERNSSYIHAERSEGRRLSHCITTGVSPMRQRTVVSLMTEMEQGR